MTMDFGVFIVAKLTELLQCTFDTKVFLTNLLTDVGIENWRIFCQVNFCANYDHIILHSYVSWLLKLYWPVTDEKTRKKNNLAMFDWILEDWMPWYKDCRDFSKLDVNRFVQLQTLPFWGWERLSCRFLAQTLPLDKCSKVPLVAVSLNYTLSPIEFALFKR